MTDNFNGVEITTGQAEPEYAVIWLHGLGADGSDFAPVVPELEKLGIDATRFIFPHAPMRSITINGGMQMRGWYDITSLQFEQRSQDTQGTHESRDLVEQLILRENRRGIASDKIMLAGFSQGGAIALFTALGHADKLAGVIALSTYLPLADELQEARSASNLKIPVFMAHGTADDIIQIGIAESSRDLMQQWDYPIEWHSYPIAHTLSIEEIADVAAWIRRVR
jgi:phospholipase/carboxylesterase